MQKAKKIVLTCGKGDCCPRISLYQKEVVIEDDYHGKVRLTKTQFGLLKEKIKSGEL